MLSGRWKSYLNGSGSVCDEVDVGSSGEHGAGVDGAVLGEARWERAWVAMQRRAH